MKRPAILPSSPAPASVRDTGLALAGALAWLKESASETVRAGLPRFGIPSENALGIPVGTLRDFAKKAGRDHALSEALWTAGIYEARLLAIFLADPARVTSSQMDRWCAGFENWADGDTACFHLFDKSPHAFSKVTAWSEMSGMFQKRAAFALLASLALHRKKAPDSEFLPYLPLIESASDDERNFVKKAVNWALRSIGSRNPALHAEALATATRLASSKAAGARWIGKDAIRQLSSSATLSRLASRERKITAG